METERRLGWKLQGLECVPSSRETPELMWKRQRRTRIEVQDPTRRRGQRRGLAAWKRKTTRIEVQVRELLLHERREDIRGNGKTDFGSKCRT